MKFINAAMVLLSSVFTQQALSKPQSEISITTFTTWYQDGSLTANGEKFNPNKLTAATWDYPFGTILLVQRHNKSVLVRVNDRGPRRDIYQNGTHLDLSRAAFARLAPLEVGRMQVKITVIQYGQN